MQWNFEKFLIGADGAVVARFNPGVEPDDAQITGRIEACSPDSPHGVTNRTSILTG